MLKQENAEVIGLKALSWLAGNEELLPVFLGATGASGDELALRASDPAFLVSVLEFLMMDDDWVVQFCDSEGLAYEMPMQAKQSLPGGEEVAWT